MAMVSEPSRSMARARRALRSSWSGPAFARDGSRTRASSAILRRWRKAGIVPATPEAVAAPGANRQRPPFAGRIPVFTGNLARGLVDRAYRRGMETAEARTCRAGSGKLVAGLILMIVGLSLLLDRLDMGL